jgi:hypothetical protein
MTISRFKRPETGSSQKVERRSIKRIVVIAAAAILTLALATTAIAYGEVIIMYLGNNTWGMAVSEGEPVKGYALAREIGANMPIDWVVDGETIGAFKGYVFSPDTVGDRRTIQNIAFGNGEMILIKPGDANGFSLKAGESISLYAELNTLPRYADKAGELARVGCYFDDDVYETYSGKLASGGVVFTIVAPCDGEFMIYVINFCAGLQNYAEISVY